jgi:O-antigen/teichoic acid export membrane protein
MTRELARFSTAPEKSAEMRNFVRTLEIIYWAIGITIGIAVCAAAPFIAQHWIKASALPPRTVQHAVMVMGIVAAVQWPVSLYQGGLMGLQRLVLVNSIRVAVSTLTGGGAVLILWLISPSIVYFFIWQVVMSAIQVTLFSTLLWQCLPAAPTSARYDGTLLASIKSFATGMTGIMISGIILNQLDKVILSKMLTLKLFGYYTLAYLVSNGLNLFILPLFNALFPRFSALAATNDEAELRRLYHFGSQLMAILVLPLAAILALFSSDIMFLWTRSPEAASIASPILSLLVVGTALNGLMYLPFTLQLAYGWTSIGLRISIFFIMTMVPAIFLMTTYYGAIGAASVWIALNFIYVLIGVPLTHRRLLRGEALRWYGEDTGLVLVAVIAVTLIGRWMFSSSPHVITQITQLGIVFIAAMCSAVLAAPRIRGMAFSYLSKASAHRV